MTSNSHLNPLHPQYVARKTLAVNAVLKRGLMTAGVNWGAARPPREVRSHVFDLLLELVFVHEEVNATAKGELEAVMKAVLEKLAVCTLECVKQIDAFNHAGALQILVELDFVKHTLARYLSLSANRVFRCVQSGGESKMRGQSMRARFERNGQYCNNHSFFFPRAQTLDISSHEFPLHFEQKM
jgi:hypothetical protein